MTPHFVFWNCPFCEEEYMKNDCFSGGKYCAVEASNDKIKGKDIILEDLRQKCLYKQLYESGEREKWWNYISKFHQACSTAINEDCSRLAHERAGLSFEKSKQCVEDSFSSDDWESSFTKNTIIDAEIEAWDQYGSGYFPAVVVNNRTFRGQLDPQGVKEAICAGFNHLPVPCQNQTQ